jgi:hypothetical protein
MNPDQPSTPPQRSRAGRWTIVLVTAILLGVAALIVSWIAGFAASPPCREPRNDSHVALARVVMFASAAVDIGVVSVMARRLLAPSRAGWFVIGVVLFLGTALPLWWAVTFSPPLEGDLFCF